MNRSLVPLLIIILAGCGGRDEAASAAGAASAKASPDASVAAPVSAAQGAVTDEKIGLPVYPGATEVEHTRVMMHNDTGETFSVFYKTSDSPAQVADFYRVEGAKLGTLQKDSLVVGEQLRSVGVDRTDGSRSAIQATTDGKGTTVIALHRFIPRK
jgi:hypothetical protein